MFSNQYIDDREDKIIIDYTLRLQATIHYISDCQQAPIHCNSCITIFDPNFLGIDTTYNNLSLHVKRI
jgi:hypothetical protein